jgi:acyl dehydratase
MEQAELSQLIDKGIAKYREKMAGAVLKTQPSVAMASAGAIRRFADGLGDPNPLWRDAEYAAAGPHRGIIAPPAFLNAVHEGQAIVGLPGLIATFVGARWDWSGVIHRDDAFTVGNALFPLQPKSRPGQAQRILQQGVLSYRNQRGETAGTCRWDMMRSQLKLGGGGSKRPEGTQTSVEPARYSEEELAAIYAAIGAENIRGDKPRFWDDVNPGDLVPPVTKGPLSLSDMVAWAAGIAWPRTALAHGPKLKFLRENPGLAYLDPSTGAPEPIAMSHFQIDGARILMGSPLPMDIGFQRVAWFTHPVTNWMGDAGLLKSLEVRLEGFVRFGDTCRLGGEVGSKRVEAGEHLVELRLTCLNQRGEQVAAGMAVAALPKRGAEQAS